MIGEHLDLDALADLLAADLLTGEDLDHLGRCPSCQGALAELEAALAPVEAALAGLPVPALPDSVAAQLEVALADERRAAAPAPAPAVERPPVPARGTVTPLAARRDRRTRWLPAASGVAAAAVLVFGAVVLFPGGEESKDGTTALSETGGIASSSTGTDYRKDGAALTQALPSLLAGTARTGAPAQLDASKATGAAGAPEGAGAGDPLARLREPPALAACLAALSATDDPGIPLALDYAAFEGSPALVVVLPAKRNDKVDLFVVGPTCSQADADVLFFTRLTRPS